eukprot:sb/3464033/
MGLKVALTTVLARGSGQCSDSFGWSPSSSLLISLSISFLSLSSLSFLSDSLRGVKIGQQTTTYQLIYYQLRSADKMMILFVLVACFILIPVESHGDDHSDLTTPSVKFRLISWITDKGLVSLKTEQQYMVTNTTSYSPISYSPTSYTTHDEHEPPEYVVLVPMLMLSIAGAYGNAVVIVTLTGMGRRTQHLIIVLSLACSDFFSSCEYIDSVENRSFQSRFLMPCIALSSVTRMRPLGERWCSIFPYLNTLAFSGLVFFYPISRINTTYFSKEILACMFVARRASDLGLNQTQFDREMNIVLGITIGYKLLVLYIMCFCYCLIFEKLLRESRGVRSRLLRLRKRKQPIRTRYLGYQPIRDQYFLIRFLLDTSYVLNPMIYSFGYKHIRSQMMASLKMNSKTKFISLDDGPPLLYRTVSQIKRTEEFNARLNARALTSASTTSSSFPVTGGNLQTDNSRGGSSDLISECSISREEEPTNQNALFRSRDWLSANHGPVFPESVGS